MRSVSFTRQLAMLRNVVVLNEGPMVAPEMLPPDLMVTMTRTKDAPEDDDARPALGDLAGRTLAQIERIVIDDALSRHNGSVPKAARELDVSASTLYRKLDAWSKAEQKL